MEHPTVHKLHCTAAHRSRLLLVCLAERASDRLTSWSILHHCATSGSFCRSCSPGPARGCQNDSQNGRASESTLVRVCPRQEENIFREKGKKRRRPAGRHVTSARDGHGWHSNVPHAPRNIRCPTCDARRVSRQAIIKTGNDGNARVRVARENHTPIVLSRPGSENTGKSTSRWINTDIYSTGGGALSSSAKVEPKRKNKYIRGDSENLPPAMLHATATMPKLRKKLETNRGTPDKKKKRKKNADFDFDFRVEGKACRLALGIESASPLAAGCGCFWIRTIVGFLACLRGHFVVAGLVLPAVGLALRRGDHRQGSPCG